MANPRRKKDPENLSDLDQHAVLLGRYTMRIEAKVDSELEKSPYDYPKLIESTNPIIEEARHYLPAAYFEILCGEREFYVCSKDF